MPSSDSCANHGAHYAMRIYRRVQTSRGLAGLQELEFCESRVIVRIRSLEGKVIDRRLEATPTRPLIFVCPLMNSTNLHLLDL